MRESGFHGTTEAAEVHGRVQGRGGPTGTDERQERRAGREGVGPDGDGSALLGEASGHRPEARSAGPAHQRGARGAFATAARDEDGDDGAGLPPKSCSLLRQERKMSFELIEAEEAHYPKALMCRALGLSRSGHHAYSTRGPSRRALEEQQLDVLVAAIFAELAGRYGAPRIQQELRRRGSCTSRKRVAASLRRQGLAARPKRRGERTNGSQHAEPIAPNRLQRDFTASAPDRVWVADTTFLPVLAGFIYLVVVIDLFSRKVVGWTVGDRLDAGLSTEALQRALARRRPAPGLIFHSDRGVEFAAERFRTPLAHAGGMVRTSLASSESTGGRPVRPRRDFQFQNARKPCRCQRITVCG